MTAIVRLRLKRRSAPKQFPFQVAYLVPAARFADIYRLFGPAFSVPFTGTNAQAVWSQPFDYVDREWNGTSFRASQLTARDHYIVVPLRHIPYGTRIMSITSAARHEPKFDGKDAWLTFRRELAAYLSAQECRLHLGPNTEDIQHICTHCPNALSQMMGHCTPGESVCTQRLTVPADALLRLPARHPRRASDDKR